MSTRQSLHMRGKQELRMKRNAKRLRAYLSGGLGNQLFIYATAKAMALDSGAELEFNIDRFKDDKVYGRKFALGMFCAPMRLKRVSCLPVRKLDNFLNLRCASFSKRFLGYCPEVKCWHTQELPHEWNGTLRLDGMWQSEKYFAHRADCIVSDLAVNNHWELDETPILKAVNDAGEKSLFLHVRSYTDIPGREDYSGCLPLDYYVNAMEIASAKMNGITCFVFSDDIVWAQKRLDSVIARFGAKAVYANGDAALDFHAMRKCRNAIMANSSFSWWAGWLGEKESLEKYGEGGLRIRPETHHMGTEYWPERYICAALERTRV